MNDKKRTARYWMAFLILAVFLIILFIWNVNAGSIHLSVNEILNIIFRHQGDATAYNIIWEIRLPRILAVIILGGALSVSGFLLQTFFNNPIAGPFVLGISSGAKLVVALLMIFFLSRSISMGSAAMIIAAFIGSMISMGFVLLVAKKVHNMSMLVISGVMIGYICSAITDFVVTFADDSNIVNLHNWSLGSFSGMSWGNVQVMAVVVLITMVIVFFMSKPIGAYQLGEVYAQNMGVNIKLFRIGLILLSSILSACVTAFAGPISFVGIAVHCKEPAENSQTDSCDSGLFSGRCCILSFLRPDRQNCICPHRAQHQLRNSSIWCTGRNLHYDPQTEEKLIWRSAG